MDAGRSGTPGKPSSTSADTPKDAQELTDGQATPAVSSVAAIRGVLRVAPFRRLWYATALSSLGDWLRLLATTALATPLAHRDPAPKYPLGRRLGVQQF